MHTISTTIKSLFNALPNAASTVLVISLVAGLGVTFGNIKFKGISIGVAGVLFVGIFFGHIGISIDNVILEFLREFGLILFVYSIGMQVGPGFLSSLRNDGLRLNLLAMAIVFGNVAIAVLYAFFELVPNTVLVGLLSGAVTNTPGLAAALQVVNDIPGMTPAELTGPATGYALAYPFGVLGILLGMIIIRLVLRINVTEEVRQLENPPVNHPHGLTITVTNPSLQGKTVETVSGLVGANVVISRLSRNGTVRVPLPGDLLMTGDVIYAVGEKNVLDRFCLATGESGKMNLLSQAATTLSSRKVIVTRKEAIGKSLAEINLQDRFSVTITRVIRAGVELVASPDIQLQFGDSIRMVGEASALDMAQKFFGNSVKKLDHPDIVPILAGIGCGVLLGSIPINFPGLSAPVKLGLAGGPLIMAIVLARIGRIGKISFFVPNSANLMLRELGITLFLSAVGLKAGEHFVEYVLSAQGLYWMMLAAVITFVPLMAVALWARLKGRLNYLHLCGLMAGSMTDPPALAFANSLAQNESPSVTYATVYPMVMILRILTAQLLVTLLLI